MEPKKQKLIEEARISKETVRIISQGIPGLGELKDEVAAALAPDAEYRVREIIEDAAKFMRHSKRNRMTTEDINAALRLRNVEPLYGLSSQEPLKFVKVSGASNLYVVEDQEVDLKEFIARDLPPVPMMPSLTAHWLAIEGIQPAIPQNPPPPQTESSAPSQRKKEASSEPDVKPLVKHVLSRELQLYFNHITKQILGDDKSQVDLCLRSVAEAPGLQQLLPYFVHFVVSTVNDNLKDLKVLTVTMRLVRALLTNPHFGIEHYCHQLLPVVLTCVVRRKLCGNAAEEDHWQLRDYSAEIVADISKKFSQTYPTLQPRITKTYIGALLDVRKPLTTHYGAIVGLTALGGNVVNFLLVPNLKVYVSYLEEELGSGTHSKTRRFEIAKVYSALMIAAGKYLHTDDEPDAEGEDKMLIDTDRRIGEEVEADDAGFLRSLPRAKLCAMKELVPQCEQRYAELFEEFGDALIPFRNADKSSMDSSAPALEAMVL